MNTLTRYLVVEIVRMSLFVLAALLGMFLFFEMINELNDLGQGTYSFGKMLVFVLLESPSHAYEFMPIAALIGGMVALSLLNQHSEFVVMRVGGLSIKKVLGILCFAGVLFAIATLLIGEYVAPNAERAAAEIKLAAKGQGILQGYRSGFWFKGKDNFVNGEALPDKNLRRLDIYQFDGRRRLSAHTSAKRGVWQNEQHAWLLSDVTLTSFDDKGLHVSHLPTQIWESVLTRDTISGWLVQPEKLSIANLMEYIDYLKESQQKTSRYEIALWTKLAYPFICIAMLIIALPFAQTQRRAGGVGLKLFVGIMLGLGFYFIDRLVANWGLLYDWSPVLSTTSPSVVLLVFALFLLWRQERR